MVFSPKLDGMFQMTLARGFSSEEKETGLARRFLGFDQILKKGAMQLPKQYWKHEMGLRSRTVKNHAAYTALFYLLWMLRGMLAALSSAFHRC